MALIVTTDAAEVARLADRVVALDPVAFTVFATVASAVTAPGGGAWAAQPADQPRVLAARSSVPFGVGLTPGWSDDQLPELAAAMAVLNPPLTRLAGPPDLVTTLAARLGRPITGRMDERLFRLDELIAPRPTAGTSRPATTDDLDLLIRWYADFMVDTFGPGPSTAMAATMAERAVTRSRCRIWLDEHGVPCSVAEAKPPVRGASRLGPVFTPREHRGRGYGSAVTADVTADVLAVGVVPCLYTDLANPTSNKIYQAIGYRPVLDRLTLRFD